MPNSNCGQADHVECFSSGALLKDVFHDSDTAMGVLSHVPGGASTPTRSTSRPPAPRARRPMRSTARSACCCTAAACRRCRARSTAWTRRRRSFQSAAFKTYTQFGPADGAAGFFLDDDRYGTPFIERARKLGVSNIAVHKGLAFGARGYEYSTARDIGPAARRHPGHDLPDLPLRLRHRA